MSKFLSGAGIENAQTNEPPRLFCGDEFATLADPYQPAMDSNGNHIPYYDSKGNQLGLRTIEEVFPSVNFPNGNPFWIPQFNAYFLDANGFDRMCGKPTLYALTGRADNQHPFTSTDPNIVTGVYDPFVLMCPLSFESKSGPHSANSLDAAITYAGYPTAGVGPTLDTYAPYSVT